MKRIECETCGGEGVCIEFRRFAGEYQAGEDIEVRCHDCGGEGSWEDETVCLCCEGPLTESGLCIPCNDAPLTEVHSDPLKRRKAA